MDCVVVPGRKTCDTPASFNVGMSSWGMMPPPKTVTSAQPRSFSASTTAGKSVRCAPDMMESPTPSTSSCTAAAAIISGVWCNPV